MTSFVLIPGADGRALYWDRLVPELQRRGHDPVPVGLPLEATSGLAEYVDAVVHTAGDRTDLVVVAQSLGAFTGPLVCERLPVTLLVLLNPMVPAPGETANDWWANTGQDEARVRAAQQDGRPSEFDMIRDFFHDLADDLRAQVLADDGPTAQVDTLFSEPWPLAAWPDVPTRFLQGEHDRFFPVEFQRRIARERLGMQDVDVIPGGHLLALSRPADLAERLDAYVR